MAQFQISISINIKIHHIMLFIKFVINFTTSAGLCGYKRVFYIKFGGGG